jgi:hypothetical protein
LVQISHSRPRHLRARPGGASRAGWTYEGSAESSCIEGFVTRFGERLFRQPVSAERARKLTGLFASLRMGNTFEESAQGLIAAMLLLPEFLYRGEHLIGAQAEPGDLGTRAQYQLAAQLAYLVTASKHGLGSGIAFTGTGVIGNGWPTGASVDQIVAGRIGNQTPIASLQLGSGCHDTNVYGRVSYAAGGKPLAPEQVPAAAFANLFKPVLDRAMPGAAGAAATDKLLARHRSVLDFVRNDVCELRAELGAEDRKRLETHCDSLRQVEKGLGGGDMLAAGASCKAPTEALVNARFTASNYEQSVKDQVALTRLALACRLTHVVCLQLGQAHGGVTASRLGVGGGHHHVSHWRGSGAGEEPYIKVSVFYAEMVAHLLGALKAVDEGGSSLLDNTVMLWGSDVTDGEEHGEDDAPWAMFGGRAMGWKTGRMLDVQKRNQNDLLISMAHAMGLPDVKTIGHEDLCSGPMPGVT